MIPKRFAISNLYVDRKTPRRTINGVRRPFCFHDKVPGRLNKPIRLLWLGHFSFIWIPGSAEIRKAEAVAQR